MNTPNPMLEHWKPGDVCYLSGIDANGYCYLTRNTVRHIFTIGERFTYVTEGREDHGSQVSELRDVPFRTRDEAVRHLGDLVAARRRELEDEVTRLTTQYTATVKGLPLEFRGDPNTLWRMLSHNVAFPGGRFARLVGIDGYETVARLTWDRVDPRYDLYRWEDGSRLSSPVAYPPAAQ